MKNKKLKSNRIQWIRFRGSIVGVRLITVTMDTPTGPQVKRFWEARTNSGKYRVPMTLLMLTLSFLCACSSPPQQHHPTIWLSELAVIREQEANKNKQWWVSYNTNALRMCINPLWDAELGLKDDGTVVWRKIAPLKK